jgi:hypothetical protein
MKHLWEVEHPYYCNLGNYFCQNADVESIYDSWDDFEADAKDEDLDMNLIFRFDWQLANDDTGLEYEQLHLVSMGQRKGIYRWVVIRINRKDEPKVKKFLKKRWEHLKKLWTPFE